jgi:hypothetical protein
MGIFLHISLKIHLEFFEAKDFIKLCIVIVVVKYFTENPVKEAASSFATDISLK